HSIPIQRCPKCEGTWYGKDQLRILKDKEAHGDYCWINLDLWRDAAKFRAASSSRYTCPADCTPLTPVHYGNANVVVDICQTCKGVWLDKGEYARIIKFLDDTVDAESGQRSQRLRCGLAAVAASVRCRGSPPTGQVAHYIRNAIRARSATAREDWRLDGGHTLHRVRGVKRTETAGRTGILRRYFPRHASPRRCRAVAHRARGRSADRSRGHRAGTSAERLLHLARPEEPGDASGLRRGVSRVMREAQVYERTDPRGEHHTLMEFLSPDDF